MSTYDDYYAAKLESALVFQDYVIDALSKHLNFHVQQYASRLYQLNIGESKTGVEIKFDDRFSSSRRLWIEFAEKSHPRPGSFVASGIMRNDNAWLYVIGDYATIFVFAKKNLVTLKLAGHYPPRENGLGTSLGYLLPEADANDYALAVVTPADDQKVRKSIQANVLSRYLLRIMKHPNQRLLLEGLKT